VLEHDEQEVELEQAEQPGGQSAHVDPETYVAPVQEGVPVIISLQTPPTM